MAAAVSDRAPAVPGAPTDDLESLLRTLNLTTGEFNRIVEHLGRTPNFTELAMFSVLWSEHCCYKNSRHLLKNLPTQGPRVVQGPGENAGVIDAGEGIHVAFKIESHNHPTAVEPYQGAATGVGGILRDIFTMNARPIANLNALRFGPMDETETGKRNRFLLSNAVRGIGDYGNCVGVPTVAGEIFFDDSYSGNPLVNAMTIGVVREPLMSSQAAGPGNPVLYVGSATGRDGMGGAAFASRELDERSHEDRPAVQVGDPFSEKLLVEACLEAFQTGCVVAAQDMGAAGLTSSSCEMAAKGGVGMRMDLDKVPAREPGMLAHEYLLSESQERMLLVLEKGREQPVLDVFAKWRLPAVVIGEVTDNGLVEILHHGETVVSIPALLLTDLAPNYERDSVPAEPDAALARRTRSATEGLPEITWAQVPGILERLFSADNVRLPVGIFRQYDRHVQNNTLLSSEHGTSGVIRLRRPSDESFSGRALAATTDCNPRYVLLAPDTGTRTAVAEAARNLVAVGAEPLAVTNNLNFGNPEKPEIYYQLYHAVAGMRAACLALQTPVTGGNVSLYNETQRDGQAIPIAPTPVIGMVGLLEDERRLMTPAFKAAGHVVALLGRFDPTLGGSEYQYQVAGQVYGPPPSVDLEAEVATNALIRRLIQERRVASVQDVSLGGWLTTLFECAFSGQLGVSLDDHVLSQPGLSGRRLDEVLFGETNATYLVSFAPEHEGAIAEAVSAAPGLQLIRLGRTTETFTLRGPLPEVQLAPLADRFTQSFLG